MGDVKLSESEIQESLSSLSGWRLEGDMLKKDFEFDDFKQAFALMTKVAEVAERMNHHPDWFNAYNKLSIALTTHHSGGLTKKDFELAKIIDQTVKV